MIKMNIVQNIGVVADYVASSKQVNLISWNDRPPVIDIRTWLTGRTGELKAGKGITFDIDEIKRLYDVLGTFIDDYPPKDIEEEAEPLPEPQIEGQMQVSDYV